MKEEKKEQQNLYTLHYIQKQEQMLLDFIRKNIDAEVRIVALNNNIAEAEARYEESQKHVELGNEMLAQAAASIESLTIERDNLDLNLSSLQSNYTALQQKNQEIISEKDKIIKETQEITQLKLNEAGVRIKQLEQELKLCDSRSQELKSEYQLQVDELNIVYKENQRLKNESSKKVKNKETPVKLPPDEF